MVPLDSQLCNRFLTSPHPCYFDAVARVVHCALGGPNWVDILIMVESVLTV